MSSSAGSFANRHPRATSFDGSRTRKPLSKREKPVPVCVGEAFPNALGERA